jgi:uncharacterized membrane protein YdjX (TVP38/TMEM64 family)
MPATKQPKNLLVKEIASLVVFGLAFVVVSFLAQHYKGQLADIVESGGIVSVGGFVLLTAIFVVFIIPLDIAFLIPIGASLWGPIPTALMSITGWALGASIAFGIARLLGVPIVEKSIGLERIRAVATRIPRHNLFWSVIMLRMLVPVDILSYALGLFSRMTWSSYVLATAIGVSPLGFYFAYAGALPFWYQLLAVVFALALAAVAFVRYGGQGKQ